MLGTISVAEFGLSHFMSLEGTLALAVRKYRTIVDSRRFIPLAPEEEFKNVFDSVLSGLLDNLPEALNFEGTLVKVDVKKIILATDILKLLIILKHFINQPVYADEILHEIFEKAAHEKDFKFISNSSDYDDHKAKKKFEQFLVNLYVLLCEDKSLKDNVGQFFANLKPSRLQTVLYEAAPRASQEEMYRKSYRSLLLNMISVNETVLNQVIKRLDSFFPEPKMIEGVKRKDFLLDKLGWKQATVYQCADRLQQRILEACKENSTEEAVQRFEYYWILLDECKFVAVDECCATLFIFPSECESFLKAANNLSTCFGAISQLPINELQAQIINNINMEISVWVKNLVRALSSNYIHFERDLNNSNNNNRVKLLMKSILALSTLSGNIYDTLDAAGPFENIELVKPVRDNKAVSDFLGNLDTLTSNISTESLVMSEDDHLDNVVISDDFGDEKDVEEEAENNVAAPTEVAENNVAAPSEVTENNLAAPSEVAENNVSTPTEVIENNVAASTEVIENNAATPIEVIENNIEPVQETKENIIVDLPKPSDHTTISIPKTKGQDLIDNDKSKSGVPVWAVLLTILGTIAGLFCIKLIADNSNKP